MQARVYNPTDQSITVKTQLLTTFTNDSGQIAYTQTAKRYDASLKYRLINCDFGSCSDKSRSRQK
ncbi:WxL protein peptidoglycan domain-containing protein [Lactiplantibacillus plantarum]|uniref:WxL protein peptidoglycan domain-containing protein n=1 Tax=Lactiplantibacillus plantarum TaxID=1590 RepID=UPI002916CB47|nr:DUF916 domain-containing protein [Lactiplantibacillus plantarum]